MHKFFLFFIFLQFCISLNAQGSIHIEGSLKTQAHHFLEELPFWMRTNTYGFLGRETNFGISAFAKANYNFSSSHTINIGLGVFARDGLEKRVQRSNLFIQYENKWFGVLLGAKNPNHARQGLSTINNNILFTGNTRALPGVLLKTSTPIKLGDVAISAEIAHYELNDSRAVSNANVHYKFLELQWQFNADSRVSAGLRHYVQWAGTTNDGLKLPSDLNAFKEVFVGSSGTGIINPNENINALGNHLGSYQVEYKLTKDRYDLNIYHHTLFEDRSGRELNNFPDGVWGIHIKPKFDSWFKGVLYEYIQTVSQSGRPTATTSEFGQQSGGDNYFINSIYRSGWTYEGAVIGLPFINPISSEGRPVNNRLYAHHIAGIIGFKNWTFQTKLSYIESLGTYSQPFDRAQRKFVSQLIVDYSLKKYGTFNFLVGLDLISHSENNAAVGLGYNYILN